MCVGGDRNWTQRTKFKHNGTAESAIEYSSNRPFSWHTDKIKDKISLKRAWVSLRQGLIYFWKLSINIHLRMRLHKGDDIP